MTTHPARQADRPEDYARLNLERRLIKPWEDSIRIDTAAPNLEWWYIDADLDDGTGLCMIFATKDGTRPNQPLGPQLEIDITKPDGTRLMRSWYANPRSSTPPRTAATSAWATSASPATCTSTE